MNPHREPEPAVELAWRTALAGCLLPVAIGGALLFVYWGANPLAVGPEEFERRDGWMMEIAASMTSNGVGWGFLAAAFVMALFGLQLGWRVMERVAVRANAQGIRVYGPFGRFVPWSGVHGVRFAAEGRPPSLVIEFAEPQPAPFSPLRRKHLRLAGVAYDAGEAAAFAEAAERLRGMADQSAV